MADGGFPGQHTTTTTVTSNTTVQTNLRFDPSYIRTIPGILKVVQIVSNKLTLRFLYFQPAFFFLGSQFAGFYLHRSQWRFRI